MTIPLQVTFEGLERSSAVEQCIREQLRELELVAPSVSQCEVKLGPPHHHHRQGDLYVVQVLVRIGEREVVVGRDHPARLAHEHLDGAIRNSFEAIKRLLRVPLGESARVRSAPDPLCSTCWHDDCTICAAFRARLRTASEAAVRER